MSQSSNKKTRISLDCSPEEHFKIKIYATLHKKTISEYILELVRLGMSQESIQVPDYEKSIDSEIKTPKPIVLATQGSQSNS